jgi:hypothetical protein
MQRLFGNNQVSEGYMKAWLFSLWYSDAADISNWYGIASSEGFVFGAFST